MSRVILLINRLPENATADELDVLDQAAAVEQALDELGIHHDREYVDANLAKLAGRLNGETGAIAFNIVESVNNSDALVYFIPALLESMNFPFTGNPSEAMFLTTGKPLAKRLMQGAGIPTPGWWSADEAMNLDPGKRYIVKPSREDASVGIEEENVFHGSEAGILEEFRARWGKHFFVEEYIPGREFNISMLGGPDGPEVLPPAEMLFLDYPADKPAILGYTSKWDESTFEYQHTERTFDLAETDSPLIAEIELICHRCWSLFHLRGYARVDFRVDELKRPYVLEINANPCISPDSGFYNAALKAGYTFTQVVERILNDR
jgi:D-alanine-D-alanine ligase